MTLSCSRPARPRCSATTVAFRRRQCSGEGESNPETVKTQTSVKAGARRQAQGLCHTSASKSHLRPTENARQRALRCSVARRCALARSKSSDIEVRLLTAPTPSSRRAAARRRNGNWRAPADPDEGESGPSSEAPRRLPSRLAPSTRVLRGALRLTRSL